MALDPWIALLGLLAGLLLAGVVGGAIWARVRRRRREQAAEDRRETEERRLSVPGSSHDLARWVAEGQQLFTTWQERVERLDELQSRLAAMGDEIGRLQAEVGRIDELRDHMTRLGHEIDRLRAERDGLVGALARVQEIAQGSLSRSTDRPV